MRKFLDLFWTRAVFALAVGAAAFGIIRLQYLSLGARVVQQEPLPYACPVAGDCTLPGDEARKARGGDAMPGGSGNDKIMPHD